MYRRKLWQIISICLFFMCLTACRDRENIEIYEAEMTEKAVIETEVREDTEEKKPVNKRNSAEDSDIYVYICGEVRYPGVVKVPTGSRVFEVIEKAGGFTKKACVTAVNQAQEVCDGQQITILTIEEAEKFSELYQNPSEHMSDKVNLNTATAEELMSLPGIGKAKAEDIMEYRETEGGFQTIDDIKKIRGIKDAVFEKIKDKIVV